MKYVSLILLLAVNTVFAQVNPSSTRVKTYRKSDGTVVETHRRTQANRTTKDNYSHTGNTNPWNGKKGYKK